MAIPIPHRVSFPEATTIPIHGLTAYALLKFAAKPQMGETLLIQSAAGGVGLYLLQLAKLLGVRKVIALVGSKQKIELVRGLGADFAVDYSQKDWTEQVLRVTDGIGADVVLEAAAGDIGEASFQLAAPERIQQLIYKNQSVIGFNLPSMHPEQLAECVPNLVDLIVRRQLKIFANHAFPLEQVSEAFAALASRETVGKVVLIP